jgi:V8-like Glu-specific endopeptidase
MGHFFDQLSVDFANPAIQELVDLLATHFELRDEIRDLARGTGVRLSHVHLERGAALVWPDVLRAARNQELHWQLTEAIKRASPAVGTRVDELLTRPQPLLEARAHPGEGALGDVWKGRPEARTGPRSALLDVGFLASGLAAAAAVCKLIVFGSDGVERWGSGFLVAPDLVLSNHHVLFERDGDGPAVGVVEAIFRYEEGRPAVTIAGLAPTIRGDRAFDWAAIRLAAPPPPGCEPMKLGTTRPVSVGDPTFIVQHPGGGPKQVGLYRNEIRYVDDRVVQYLTETRPGSSGSPVCNTRWEVIALHHRSLTADSAVVAEVRNQGVRFERVLDGLRSHALLS